MESYIARQPIFDVNKNVEAYELLFRGGMTDSAPTGDGFDGTQASSHVMTNALTLFGLENITNGKRAFINMTRDVLVNQLALVFDNKSLVIEILEDVPADAEVIEACRHYKKLGYTLAMDDVVDGESREELVALSEVIKIDFMLTDEAARQRLATRFLASKKILLAEKVETHEEFVSALDMGFTLFQGYFFAKPELLQRKEMHANKLNSLRLIAQIHNSELDLSKIEDIIKNDVSMSYRLLRYINSAFFSFRTEISSIRQAVVLLGSREFRKWSSLIALSGLTDDKPAELMVTGLIRAQFFEKLAPFFGLSKVQDDLFLLGMFSILDGATDRTFEEIFEEISLQPQIRDALLLGAGQFAFILNAMKAFEQGDWTVFASFVADNRGLGGVVTQTYLEAVQWANQSISAIAK